MKILYAIQGTGNGHVSRARNIIPLLQQKGEVDILISGYQADVQLDCEVKYKFQGLGFIFGKKGGVDFLATYQKNNLRQLWKEIQSLPIETYDVVINDFEPVSAWACYLKGIPCVSLSHQSAVLNSKAPQPKSVDALGMAILKYYAPTTLQFGFHFKPYNKNIFTPVIRRQVREMNVKNKGHYTVYLPAYSDGRLLKVLSLFKDIEWDVFSKHNKDAFRIDNISIRPIDNEAFVESMANAAGILCGAGFETPAEALFLKKKVMVIPMKGQYEQQCNAAALKKMGIPVIKSLKEKHAAKIEAWLSSTEVIPVDYPEITAEVVETVFQQYPAKEQKLLSARKQISSAKRLKSFIVKKVLSQVAG